MNLPPGTSRHNGLCVALSRYHAASSGGFAPAADWPDKDFHGRMADAFAACITLPPSQMRMVLFLSSKFPAFVPICEKMVGSLLDARRLQTRRAF